VNKSPNTPKSLRKRFTRVLDEEQIHWRNVELLTQFMTRTGMIKNRWQTRLHTSQQVKLRKQVEKARHRFLLPIGAIQSTDRINLTDSETQFREYNS